MAFKKLTIRNCIFRFKCTAKWEELSETQNSDARFCTDCQKQVYFCHSDEELVKAVKLNRCVAIVRKSEDESGEGLTELTAGMVVPEIFK